MREIRVANDTTKCCRACEWWQWIMVREVVSAPGVAIRACVFDLAMNGRVAPGATTPDETCDDFEARREHTAPTGAEGVRDA